MNIFIVFLVSGLWHGAAWTFVVWGALHGFYQIIGNLTYKKRNALLGKIGLSEKSAIVLSVRRLITLLLVSFAWIFFRADSLSDAAELIDSLFTGYSGRGALFAQLGINFQTAILIILSIGVLLFMDRLVSYEGEGDGSDAILKGGSFIYIIWIIIIVWVLLFSKDMVSTFIYFAF